jgi:hypothetical protein
MKWKTLPSSAAESEKRKKNEQQRKIPKKVVFLQRILK